MSEILAYDPDGVLQSSFDSVPGAGSLDPPVSLTFDGEGNLSILTIDLQPEFNVSPNQKSNRLLKIDLSPEPGVTPVATPVT